MVLEAGEFRGSEGPSGARLLSASFSAALAPPTAPPRVMKWLQQLGASHLHTLCQTTRTFLLDVPFEHKDSFAVIQPPARFPSRVLGRSCSACP